MYEKLILEDNVDFVVAPCCTAWHFAIAPLCNQYGHPLIGVTVSSNALVLKAAAGELSYYFTHWPPPSEVGPALVDLLAELGVESVGLLYLSTLYGIEYAAAIGPQLAVAGIANPIMRDYPYDILDFSLLIKELQSADVDALIAISYAEDATLLTEQMTTLGYNPDVFFNACASHGSSMLLDKFGGAHLEGMMTELAWNKNMPYPGAMEFYDGWVSKYGRGPDMGAPAYVYASMEVYEQAIEIAGTLDRNAVRDVMASETFTSITGDIYFGPDNYNESYPGFIGQFHNGLIEVAYPTEQSTLDVIYPKPAWPE